MASEQEQFDERSRKDQNSTPKPDPTALTSEALKDAIVSLRTLIDQRINATEQLFEQKIASGVQGGLAFKELFASQVADLREVLNERYATQTKALDAAFLAQQAAVATSFDASEKAMAAALLAAKEAVEKANLANEKRFDSVNEFRAQLNDMVNTLLPRQEATAIFSAMDARITDNKDNIAALKAQDAAVFGVRAGGKEMWAYIVGALGLMAMGLTAIVNLTHWGH